MRELTKDHHQTMKDKEPMCILSFVSLGAEEN